MERLVQWLDDLDDLIAIIGLVSERIRSAFYSLICASAVLAIQIGGVVLALMLPPPLALALAVLLFVCLLYHNVTSRRLEIA